MMTGNEPYHSTNLLCERNMLKLSHAGLVFCSALLAISPIRPPPHTPLLGQYNAKGAGVNISQSLCLSAASRRRSSSAVLCNDSSRDRSVPPEPSNAEVKCATSSAYRSDSTTAIRSSPDAVCRISSPDAPENGSSTMSMPLSPMISACVRENALNPLEIWATSPSGYLTVPANRTSTSPTITASAETDPGA